ncbi:putative ribonuclease H-like domain-containing protein, partial [Tanacetum coccineum]
KLSPVLEEEPKKKPKKAKKPAKKSTNVPSAGVVIIDTPGVYVSKKKAPAKVDSGKGMDILSYAALLEAAQVKEALKKSKKDSHMLYASGSSDGVGSQPKVPDESKDKTTSTNKGTGTKPEVPDVPKYQSESEKESWGYSEDDDSKDDASDDVSKHHNDDADSDIDGDNDASDSERTDSNEEENPNLNLKYDEEEETQDNEHVHTPDYYVPTDEETNYENNEFDEEEYDELYVRSKDTKHEKEEEGNAEMTDVGRENFSQEKSYEQVVDDAHVTPTAIQKTEGSMQSSSVSSDFASKFLNLDNVPLVNNEVASMMNVKVNHSTQLLASIKQQIPAIVDDHISTRIGYATQTALQSYTAEFEKKDQEEKDRYIDLIEKSIKVMMIDQNHEDASDMVLPTPKQQQRAMEMEHYLEYIDNDVWKVIQNGNYKKRISTGKRFYDMVMLKRSGKPSDIAREKRRFLCTERDISEVEETNHALMAISSSSEVSLYSKTCIDLYNTLKTLCDEQMNQLGDQEAQILAYSQAIKKLEAQLVTFQKQQLFLNEKLTFQANEIYEKDEKLKRYRRIGMKVVKEKEQLQKILDSWKDSSKSSNSKVRLGFEIQSNNECRILLILPAEHSGVLNLKISSVPPEVYMSKLTQMKKASTGDFEEFNRGFGTFGRFAVATYLHKVLFTETECLVVSSDFKMPDENQILLKVPKHHNMYSFDMKTPTPAKGFACLIAKATSDESKLWYRRLANPLACASEETNSAGTSQTPCSNASEERDKDVELIVVPSTVKNIEEKAESRKSSINSKAKEEILPRTSQEKKASSTNTSKDNPKILAFRIELEEIALKHLGKVSENTYTSTPSVNTGNEPVNTGSFDPDDSPMPKLKIFHKSETGIFDVASYDKEGVITDFNSLPIEIEVSPTPTFRIHNIHLKSQILGDPKKLKEIKEGGCFRIRQDWLAQGYTQEEGIDYDMVFVLDKKDIMLVQVYVDDIIFGSTKKSWCDEFEALMKSRFQMSSMGELTFFLGLQVKQNKAGIFISQDKYVAEILKKFDLVNVKTAITPMETKVALTKDEEAVDVDVHLYRSMIGSLMYLTASRPDIMYAVCVCSRFQVTPKTSHLNTVKRIFKYLKGKPHLALWYLRESPFDLEAFSDNDYGGSNLDRKSTTGGCQFLGQRLISWQCKKQTIVATSTTKAEYVAAANCYGQVLWVQNQLLDYGFNFMNTKIHIDNESTICIMKNPIYHSKIKHIEICHHFIRDCLEKKLISVEKIHTDLNVADLLTKPFDGPRFNYLVVSIGMINS